MSGFIGKDFRGRGFFVGDTAPTDGQILTFGTATSTWDPTDQLAGIGSNVVTSVKTSYASTSSTSYTSTGLSASITPTSSSSKVLAIAMVNGSASTPNGPGGAGVRIARSGAAMPDGDAAGSRTPVAANLSAGDQTVDRMLYNATLVWLDSPSTTSSVTYNVEFKKYANSVARINGSNDDLDSNTRARATSSLVLIEVAA